IVTPKRPEATCLIAERRRSPLGSGWKRAGSSPPSPVLERPPRRFMAIASVSWASRDMEPRLIAPVQKRRTISFAGSTSESGIACPPTCPLADPSSPPGPALAPDPQEPAQGRLARRVLVDGCRVLAVLLESGRVAHLRVRGFIAPERSGDIAVDRANSVLDQGDRLGVPHVVLAVATPRIDATHRQKVLLRGGAHPPGARMALQGLDREHLQADTTDARGGAGEVAVDQLPLEPDGLEDLGATVGLDRGDAHLGDRLQEALADRLDRVL